MQNAQARASGARTRLCALEQEHQDLAQQLAEAHQDADKLQHSVRACQPHRNGTLDSLVLATRALINDLEQATRDEAGLRQRGRDLIDESEVFTARCEALHKCFTAAEKATSSICGEIDAALNGLPERARPSASQAPHTAQGGGT
jgi:predicted  nucleic acid-binding Zn-ribbon protein